MGRKSKICFGIKRNPLTEYASEDEAKKAAEFVRQRYNKDQQPYLCRKCRQWHLGSGRQLIRSTYSNCCSGRHGNPKKLYPTEYDAMMQADLCGGYLRVYPCPHGCGFHLTSH